MSDIVQKLWGFCHTLRHDGVDYRDYIGSFFALSDQIEARCAKAQTNVDKLIPSFLAKAFRGELVPQDPNDEPASQLLERITRAQSFGKQTKQ